MGGRQGVCRRWDRRRLAAACIALAMVAGCGAPPGGGTDAGAETLRSGGTVVSAHGVHVGAPPGTLETPVQVQVVSLDAAPDLTTPSSITTHGSWYRLGADRDVDAPAGGGFLLGLPVPAGADPDRLAVAVRVPAEENWYEGRDVAPGPEGHADRAPDLGDDVAYLRGHHDPERGLFFVALYHLPEVGDEVALVEGPGFAPGGAHASGPAPQAHQRFVTYCHPEFGDADVAETCRFEDLQDAMTALEDAYADYTGIGFAEPRMYREPRLVGYQSGVPVVEPGPWVMTIRACSQTGSVKGKFTGAANATSTWACIGANGVTAGAVNTIRHEYVHAVQWAYTALRTSFRYWITESTATAAERSLTMMARDTGRGVRDVDVSLHGGAQKYATQDFWLYLGLRHGLGLDYLIPLFEDGADTDAADDLLADEFDDHAGLGDAFWAWAKNQAFEKAVPLGGDGFATTCGLDRNAEGRYYALAGADGAPVPVSYAREAPPGDTTLSVAPLSAKIVRLSFEAWSGGTYDQGAEVLGHPDLRVKYYPLTDRDTERCWTRGESRAHHVTVSANARVVHVLVANVGRTAARTATLRFPSASSGPSVDILAPPQQSVHTEGDIAFRAAASGFGGTDPSLLQVRWWHEVDGLMTVLANSASGEFVDIELCHGSYHITADVTDPLTSETASDTVSITVERADDPPEACAPMIDIVQPLPSTHATYPAGEPVYLEAVVDADEPEFPVEWRVGEWGQGRIVATGLTGTAKLPSGLHTLWAVYGSARDGITVRIADEDDRPPTATITEPPDDLTISYVDEPSCNVQVPLAGTGSDPEDGTLTGSDLAWSYRDPSLSSRWTTLGTGETQTLGLRCGESLEVRLTATDGSGNHGSDTRTITYLPPPN